MTGILDGQGLLRGRPTQKPGTGDSVWISQVGSRGAMTWIIITVPQDLNQQEASVGSQSFKWNPGTTDVGGLSTCPHFADCSHSQLGWSMEEWPVFFILAKFLFIILRGIEAAVGRVICSVSFSWTAWPLASVFDSQGVDCFNWELCEMGAFCCAVPWSHLLNRYLPGSCRISDISVCWRHNLVHPVLCEIYNLAQKVGCWDRRKGRLLIVASYSLLR